MAKKESVRPYKYILDNFKSWDSIGLSHFKPFKTKKNLIFHPIAKMRSGLTGHTLYCVVENKETNFISDIFGVHLFNGLQKDDKQLPEENKKMLVGIFVNNYLEEYFRSI